MNENRASKHMDLEESRFLVPNGQSEYNVGTVPKFKDLYPIGLGAKGGLVWWHPSMNK